MIGFQIVSKRTDVDRANSCVRVFKQQLMEFVVQSAASSCVGDVGDVGDGSFLHTEITLINTNYLML